jgi:hypothetical protein
MDWESKGSDRNMLQAMTVVSAGLAVGAASSPQHVANLTCTNPASGWRWEIKIDYMRGTVDSYPADISADTISWHDAKDAGNYTLERNSGDLSAAFPSSTGGYILYEHCASKAPR